MTPKQISLESVDIDGLFGRPEFRLHLDQERPTILTGANGSGKSTILKIISALSNGDVVTLASAPLTKMTLNFRGLPAFSMRRKEAPSAGFDLKWGEQSGEITVAPKVLELPAWAITLLEECGFDVVEASDRISEIAAGPPTVPFAEYMAARETFRAMGDGPPIRLPEWLPEFGSAFPVLFVSDQRLVTERSGKRRRGYGARQRTSSLAVESASYELSEQIDKAFSRYGQKSQQLDRNFPEHLIAAMSDHVSVSASGLADLTDEVERRRESLKQVGLLEQDAYGPEISPSGYDDENLRTVMQAFLGTTLQKFDVFDELEERLSSFKLFLDKRFAPKSLVLGRGEGMRFRSADGQEIRPRQLSSGEQQMTVLAYEILFRAKENTLVIVDEPELSLHVLWQDSLVDDLTQMGSISGLQFLMATHSPTIVAEHPELERPLPSA